MRNAVGNGNLTADDGITRINPPSPSLRRAGADFLVAERWRQKNEGATKAENSRETGSQWSVDGSQQPVVRNGEAGFRPKFKVHSLSSRKSFLRGLAECGACPPSQRFGAAREVEGSGWRAARWGCGRLGRHTCRRTGEAHFRPKLDRAAKSANLECGC